MNRLKRINRKRSMLKTKLSMNWQAHLSTSSTLKSSHKMRKKTKWKKVRFSLRSLNNSNKCKQKN